MKAATSTLREQLALQPGIFMAEPKEPNFFSDDAVFAKGFDWYKGLFTPAGQGDILGEASTHYTKLPTYPSSIERLRLYVPDARFIYIMRHPVDRLVSHYIHEWSMGVFRCSIDTALKKHPEMISYGMYAEQLQPYFDAFGSESILPVFFDRLVKYPQEELERVCGFVGYAKKPEWVENLGPSNISSKRIKRFPLYNLIVDSAPAIWVRRRFIPKTWRELVKGRLTMKQRPELDESLTRELVAIFNEDLAKLGSFLGVEIDCANFKQITSSTRLDWVDA